MATQIKINAKQRQKAPSGKLVKNSMQERRVATPRQDLVVVKYDKGAQKAHISKDKQASGVLAKVAKAMSKPGADRARVFRSTSARPVYAYFVDSRYPSKVIREDEQGRQTIGRLVGGRFRESSSVRE